MWLWSAIEKGLSCETFLCGCQRVDVMPRWLTGEFCTRVCLLPNKHLPGNITWSHPHTAHWSEFYQQHNPRQDDYSIRHGWSCCLSGSPVANRRRHGCSWCKARATFLLPRDNALTTRQELRDIIQALEKQSKHLSELPCVQLTSCRSQCFLCIVKSTLNTHRRPWVDSRYNSNSSLITPIVSQVLKAADEPIRHVVESVSKLSQAASRVPYYKFNNMWSRQTQGAVPTLCNKYTVVWTDGITGRELALLGLARWLQVRRRPGTVRSSFDHGRAWRDAEE